MKTLQLLFIPVFLVCGSWTSKDESDSAIEWSNKRLLNWEDFQGEVNPYSHADAATSIKITATPHVRRKKITYDVSAYFMKNKSWQRNTSESLLKHEQLHFDLAELYARKIRKQISEYHKKGVNDVHVYNAMIHRLLNESNQIDENYDERTIHGALKEKQQQWQKNIHAELRSLDFYSRERWVSPSF